MNRPLGGRAPSTFYEATYSTGWHLAVNHERRIRGGEFQPYQFPNGTKQL
jgi:hypothetical protein